MITVQYDQEKLLLKKATLYLHIFRDSTRFKYTVVDIYMCLFLCLYPVIQGYEIPKSPLKTYSLSGQVPMKFLGVFLMYEKAKNYKT